jgi:hypothetical protein
MSEGDAENADNSDSVIPSHAVPAEELARYSVERDPHREKDIADYVESQARDESVEHVERVKEEVVLGDLYEIWDVTTGQG